MLVVNSRDIAVSLMTCVLSLAIAAGVIVGKIGIVTAVLLQLGVVALLVLFLIYSARCGRELTVATLLAVGTFVGGPIGAVGGTIVAFALWRQRPAASRLRDWYDTITGIVAREQSARIRDDVVLGRLPADPAASVDRLGLVLSGHSMADQQRVVGVIGRQYHPDLRPLLRRALRNPNAMIRAQAAAVASRLDLAEKNHLWASKTAPTHDVDTGLDAGGR
jgi:hypothetical protein